MGGASLVFGALALFIASEKSFLHLSRNARRIFWYLFSCALTVWLIRWVHSLEGAGMAWVLLSATLAASVVEDEVSKKLGLTMLNIEATQRLRAALRSPEAQGKAERVMDIVSSISRGRGYTLGAKQLVGRVSGTTARLQRTLRRVLEGAEEDELNYLLCTINCPAMVEVCGHATMDLLVRERLPELTTVARAVLVDALQKLGLRYRPRRQQWARDVLVNTHGLQLTYLKCYLDDGGDFHSTYKLMSHDLQGSIQTEVAEHFKTEGQALAAEFRRYSTTPGVMLKVVSDIDDTLFSSGGSWPAGIDNRYPKKCYYPGALTLYTELDRCFTEKHQKALLHYVLGWAPPEVADNPRTASSALFQTLAAKKLSRFREFAAAWPESCFLFLGDNGQGDVLCAEVLWSSMRPGAGGGGKSRLLACLVHKVAPIAATYSMVRSKAGDKATWITAWKQRNIHLSKSHVGIAVQAFTLGLLDVQGLHRVCAAAVMDFRRIWARYSGRHAGRHLPRALAHLQKDLKTARYYLPPEMGLPSLLLAEAAAGSLASAPPPPPSPARSLLGSSPPSVSFHRMYGWTASMTEHAEAVMD